MCVAEPAAAKAALSNAEGLYEEHADFFQTEEGMFGPRSAQLEISREARTLLKTYLAARAGELPDVLRQTLVPTSEWPDAGNRLMHRYLADALVSPDSPDSLRKIVGVVVERAVLAGARERAFRLSRALLRFRVRRELTRAIAARRAQRRDTSADLLDVVVRASGADVPAALVAEVFLSCVFAVAGSVGFVLGWSLYLWGTHPSPDALPSWVVRESLRLWPVAWLLSVRPRKAHEVAGVAVTPEDKVLACPYLVHRHPGHWPDPESFRPERWADLKSPPAFIPFGWGPHTCPAALLSMGLVEDVLRILSEGYQWTVTAHGTRPFVGSALAPPRFTLSARPRTL
ncbi:cytochrome P450 [Corallococcus sp. CA053C]|uniref:cytochrome P450 n=1 Tax=Corallococcus sp. CA053C TaxID=2316732 RepID=UPI000EA1E081|nr:cytochrome P450 [Corallococcus sp. CA053C]RKH15468.1 cytochrome P450 [Corallococcus sp. CA053C]